MSTDPKLREFATPRQLEVLDAIEKARGGIRGAARLLNVHKSTIQCSLRDLKAAAARRGHSPDHDMIRTVPDGFLAKGVSTYYNADGKPTAQWVKSAIDPERQREIMNEAFGAMAQTLPRQKPIKLAKPGLDDLANLVVFTDYHLGQLSWAREGGADWDLKIAEKTLFDAFCYMIVAAPAAGTCIIDLQGDFLHTNGLLPLTPAHGHVLDADGRFSKIVAVAIRVIRRIINLALEKHDRVHLIVAEGNHDETASLWLRHMFSALYEDEPRMSVNDSELPYYVYQHGTCMLAFHHGHKLNPAALPLLFAAQFPQIWGATTKRHAHCGHRHHTDEKEYNGMIVTQHQTLAARDAHASRGGWIADRAAQVITYHKRFGQMSRVTVCPEMLQAA